MAVTASFVRGTLTVSGDGAANTLTVARDASGVLRVNGGAVQVVGGTATVANTALIQVFGIGDNDSITLDESQGTLPAAYLLGGVGNDTLSGASADDILQGSGGHDVLLGRGGDDLLLGGIDDDVLVGGDGSDSVFGESGDDRLIWNPGDDSDVFEGGAGIDSAEINGGAGSETFAITVHGARVSIERTAPAPFAIDAGTIEQVVMALGGGDDRMSVIGDLASVATLTVDGGAGNDEIQGGNGADLLIGGEGHDAITGRAGDDSAQLGNGNDRFVWNVGDGSDRVDGDAGTDTLLLSGSGAAEVFVIGADAGRTTLARSVGSNASEIDLGSTERIELVAGGGADTITIRDLGGGGVGEVRIDLGLGDGAADTVAIDGSAGADRIVVTLAPGGTLQVDGLAARLVVLGFDAGIDRLRIAGLGGDDEIRADAVPGAAPGLVFDGGEGNDLLSGSARGDTLIGGAGDDRLFGNAGNDLLDGGPGIDTLVGGTGTDTLLGGEVQLQGLAALDAVS